MNYNEMEERILGILSETYPNGLTYSEVCRVVGSTRKNKSTVSSGLSALCLSGDVMKDKKRYKLKQAPQEKMPSSSSAKLQEVTPPRETKKIISRKLIEGIFDATSLAKDRSFAFVRCEDTDYFVDSEDTLNAYHGDKVMIEPASSKGHRDHGIVRRIVARANEKIPGSISYIKGRWVFVATNPKIHHWFEVSNIGGAKPEEKVILTVTNWGNQLLGKLPVGQVTEILGLSGDPQVELLAVIRQYNLPLEFPEDVLTEVGKIDARISEAEISRRTDLRKVFTFTIDPASAKDFDDAISIKAIEGGWRLWVHIADVAHYLPISSITFQEAAKRGNSFYFPKKVIPMIPERLSNMICSLRPDEDKLCMTIETDFDNHGKVKKQRMYESVIRSDFRLSYEEVDRIFEARDTASPMPGNTETGNLPLSATSILLDALHQSRLLSRKLSQIRKEAGYIFFDLPEIEYEYDEDGFVHHLGVAEETESHKLIENFMLVANEYSAAMLSSKAPVTMYRTHEDPDTQKIERLRALLAYYGIPFVSMENMNLTIQYLLASLPNSDYHKVFDRIILRSMKKAKYSTQHIRHFGLALENYTHFTSPIRRLCDLVIHHLCKRYICKTVKQSFSMEQISHWAKVSTEQELQADAAERDIERVYSATFMKDHIGEEFTGIITSGNSSSLFVRLQEMPISAVLKKEQLGSGKWEFFDRELRFANRTNGVYFQLLDRVKVKVIEVSDDVYLELLPGKDAHVHYQNITQQSVSPKKGKTVDATKASKKTAPNNKKTTRKRHK